MKLYEIDGRIMEILMHFEEDAEVTEENLQLFDELEALQIEKKAKVEGLIKWVLNLRADREGIKAEIARLKAIDDNLGKKEERITNLVGRYCPDTEDFGIARVKYTPSEATEIQDEEAVKAWLMEHKHAECIKAKYEVQKTPIKALLKKGEKIPGVELVKKRNLSIK